MGTDAPTSTTSGLTAADAAARLRRDGPNRLPEHAPPRAAVVLARQFVHFFALLLWAAGGLAFAAAALWLVHPLQTSAVTYLSQRAESLVGLLLLATLACSLRGWSVGAVVCCALGMASKEVMAVAPVLVLLHDRTFLAGSFREALRRRPAMYAGLAATWGLLAALVLSTHGRGGSVGFDAGTSPWEYAATQPAAIATYLGLAVWPHPLVIVASGRLESEKRPGGRFHDRRGRCARFALSIGAALGDCHAPSGRWNHRRAMIAH